MTHFADALQFLRKRAGLTQAELAKKVGITRSALGNYESGTREPDFETLEAFADFFNVDLDVLFSRQPLLSGLSAEEQQLIWNYRDSSEEIRLAAFTMLQNSASAKRKNEEGTVSSAG